MIQIKLGPRRPVDPDQDPLHREHVGWAPDLDDDQVYEAGRGCWVLGAKADGQDYALISAEGLVRLAVQIERLVPAGEGRRAIQGRILPAEHPVAAEHVGLPEPVPGARNPIAYVDSPRYCRCGCGQVLTSPWHVPTDGYRPGHDRRALVALAYAHGGMAQFLDQTAQRDAWEGAYARAGELLGAAADPQPGAGLWARHCLAALLYAARGELDTVGAWGESDAAAAALDALGDQDDALADQARAWLLLYSRAEHAPDAITAAVESVRGAAAAHSAGTGRAGGKQAGR
ncbi:hypothetical protein [Nocardiopsis synnemataformans]|uniref:hypothetical protein n=1 Tax=Nocardiopsis synnemataformans TaxID=61305 RepID=UPI003EB9977B